MIRAWRTNRASRAFRSSKPSVSFWTVEGRVSAI